ncbi:hypothetical protein BVY03_01115 [bacterium K02(2017)]|nr:hypothetical protein BVY03_01115 [bacterium K02(2017)]
MKFKSHLLRLGGFSIGLLILYYTINSFGGFEKILHNLIDLNYFYLFVIINSFGWMVFYTIGWRQIMSDVNNKIKYLSLLKVKLSGEGVNFMTPLGFIAGDPVRVLLLKKYIGPEARLRSVVVDRMIHSLSAQIFCFIGVLLIFTQKIDFPIGLHIVVMLVYSLLVAFFISMLYSMTSGRGFGLFEGLFRFFKIEKRLPRVHDGLENLRENLEYYNGRSKMPMVISFLCHLAGRILGATEIMIIFYCYQGEANFIFAIILASLTSFFSIVMGWIPGALGVIEYVYAQFFMLYGFSSEVGISVQIVRRLRVFFWVAVGIFLLDYAEISKNFNKIKQKKV